MTLEQLRIFVEVAQREHLTQAASALALTPSAVSASIRVLEERYGTPLFNRVGRRIELSEAGRLFLPEARITLASARTAERTLSELGGLQRGTLQIQASQTIASYWLPPLLVQFRQRYPQIELSLTAGNTRQVAQAVAEVGRAIGHRLRHLPRIVGGEAEFDLRIALAELHQQRRQPVAGDGLAGLDLQGAALQAAQLRQGALGRARTGQRDARLRQEQPAGFAELDAPPDPVEQRRAIALFQHADRGADGRRRQRQRAGGLSQMFALGHFDKDA